MKKVLIITAILMTTAAFARENDPGIYATKGIMEIGGSIAASVAVQDESQQYAFDLAPAISYFVIDRVHLGIRPIYRYNLNYTNATKSYDSDYEILPTVSAGYAFPLSEKLFLDIAPQFGFLYANFFSSEPERKSMHLYYGLLCSLKYDFGGSLLHVNLEQFYRDRLSDEGPEGIYKLMVGVGWSFYF